MLAAREEGLRYLEEALGLYRAVGDRNGESAALGLIGNAYYKLGEIERALDYYNRALKIQQELGNPARDADTLDRIGVAYAASGGPGAAGRSGEPTSVPQ